MAEKKAFLVRLSPEVIEAIRKLAGDELRSVNAQIEVLLREALRARGRDPAKERKKPREPD
ncbi:MAG: hypothetical protein KatS3mg015_0082 [Fimbriimonadales bacterium]|nr:MAG: hypothetical protein KatS3mg015_0082 [Fimbriimonadales bacterium]